MSNYTKTTNFTAKDALTTGDPNKKVKGSDVDTEFDNIASMSATKANKVSSPTEGNVAKLSAGGDLVDAGYSFSALSGAVTALTGDINLLTGLAAAGLTTTELGYVNGVTSAIQTQLNAKQASSSNLTALAALAVTDGNFIVGNGTTWVAESGATARASLGIDGSSGNVSVTGDLSAGVWYRHGSGSGTLSSTTPASIVTDLPAGKFEIRIQTAMSSGGGQYISMRTDTAGGASYDSGASDYYYTIEDWDGTGLGGSTTTGIVLTGEFDNAGISYGNILIKGHVGTSTSPPMIEFTSALSWDTASTWASTQFRKGRGVRTAVGPINAIQIFKNNTGSCTYAYTVDVMPD